VVASDVYILYIAIDYTLLKDSIDVVTLHGITIRQKCICSKVNKYVQVMPAVSLELMQVKVAVLV